MEAPAPGSGAAEPVEEDRIEEPAHGSTSQSAAAPPPPLATQAGGGADGSSPATVADPRKGKEPLPPRDIPPPPSPAGSSSSSSSSTRSHDYGAAFRAGVFGDGVTESSTATALRAGAFGGGVAEGGSKARVRWSHPVVAETREVPDAAEQPFDSKTVFEQMVIERLIQEQVADEKANRRREQQLNSLRAEEAMYRQEQEKLSQVKAVVKVRPKQEKLPQVKGKSIWSKLKNNIFRREGREICSQHVKHQTHPITEVRRHYKLASDEANHLDAYSECRPVIGDGECFYRSFIFSYLEQVIDRQDTHEEQRLLDVVERLSTQHANLGWNSEFSRSSRAFKNLIKKVKKWKRHGRWNSMESTSSYRKEKLLNFFSEYDTTLDIFVFLRLVVAIQICSHREVYEQLIPGLTENYSLEDWCFRRVTPARRFTDHVMMLALATALEVPLRVERVRGVYHPDIYTVPGVPRPSVTLLYSGNHYEIIYPRAPSAESSSHQASQREDPTDQSSSHQASKREDPAGQS